MLTARIISLLMGRNVVGDAAHLNGICSHAHQLIGLEWSIGVVTHGLLPQDIGGGASREKDSTTSQCEGGVAREVSDTIDGVSCTA